MVENKQSNADVCVLSEQSFFPFTYNVCCSYPQQLCRACGSQVSVCKQHKYPVRMVSTHVVINCRGEEKTFSPSHMLWLSIRTLQTFKSLVTIFQTNFQFEMLTFKWIFVCETGDSEVQRTMLELLNQLDGFEATKNIKVVMATNRIDILDSALLRPGRIDRKIEFPPPNEEVRLWGSLNFAWCFQCC